jgi:hypothetical protein
VTSTPRYTHAHVIRITNPHKGDSMSQPRIYPPRRIVVSQSRPPQARKMTLIERVRLSLKKK